MILSYIFVLLSNWHEQKICDFVFPHVFIMDKKTCQHLYHIWHKYPVSQTSSDFNKSRQNENTGYKTMSTYWVNKSNSFSFLSQLTTRRTKETFSVCLFISVLAPYLFTPVTHLFFPPISRPRSPLRLSLTHRRCDGAAAEREGSGWPSETNYGGAAATQKLSDGWGSCIYSWGNWQHSDTHTRYTRTHTHTHTHTHIHTQVSTKK